MVNDSDNSVLGNQNNYNMYKPYTPCTAYIKKVNGKIENDALSIENIHMQ